MTMALEPIAADAGEDLAQKEVERKVKKAATKGAKGPAGRSSTGSKTYRASTGSMNKAFQGTVSRPRSHQSSSFKVGGSSVKSYKSSQGTRERSLNLKPPKALSGGSGHVSTLMVEWIIGLILIFWAMFSGNKQKISSTNTHNFFWQFFAWNFVFFILALFMRGKNTGRVAVMFGGILLLALVLLNTTQITALSQLFSKGGPLGTFPGGGTANSGPGSQGPNATLLTPSGGPPGNTGNTGPGGVAQQSGSSLGSQAATATEAAGEQTLNGIIPGLGTGIHALLKSLFGINF